MLIIKYLFFFYYSERERENFVYFFFWFFLSFYYIIVALSHSLTHFNLTSVRDFLVSTNQINNSNLKTVAFFSF